MAKENTNPEENDKGDLNSAAGSPFPGFEGTGDADPGIFIPEGLLDSGASAGEPLEQTHGQFDGDELEFETWMFDAGDGRGVVVPEDAGHATGSEAAASPEPLPIHAEAPAAHPEQQPGAGLPDGSPVQVSGHAVPTPDFTGAAVVAPEQGESAVDFIYGAAQSLPADLDRMASTEHTGAPVSTLPRLSPQEYPSTPSGWNDQMLASVDDFSSVLLAMRGAPSAVPAVEVETPASPKKRRSQAHKAVAETATMAEVAGSEAEVPVAEVSAAEHAEPVQAHAEEAASAEAAPAMAALPDFSWLNQPEATIEPEAAAPEAQAEMPAEAPFTPAEPQSPEYAGAAPEAQAPTLEHAGALAEGSLPASSTEDAAALAPEPETVYPDWAAPDEGLPPWLLEVDQGTFAPAAETAAAPAPDAASYQPAQELPSWATVEEQPAGGEWGSVQVEESPAMVPGAAAETGESFTRGAEQGTSLEPVAAVIPEAPAQEQAVEEMPVLESPSEAAQMPEAPVLEAVEPFEPFAPEAAAEFSPAGSSEQAAPAAQGAHGFNADEMEFESFMFDQGKMAPLPSLPNIGEFMPAVRAMESTVEPHFHGTPGFGFTSPVQEPETPVDIQAQLQVQSQQQAQAQAAQVQMESVVPTEEELPFWLEDRSQEAAPGALPSLTAEDLPALPLTSFFDEVEGASEGTESEPAAESLEEFDFSELPPIEPFDFSLIQGPEEEEQLGFRTEDLVAGNQAGHEPLVVTANLDVLADLLGKDIPAASPGSGADAFTGIPAAASTGTPVSDILSQLAVPEVPAAPQVPAEPHAPGWTATETSKLSSDTVSHLTDKIGPTEMPVVASQSSDEMTISDLNVLPFDLTDLDLEDDETSTEFLETTSLNKQNITTAFPKPEKILTGTLFGQASPQEPEYWEAPDWMADVLDTGLIGMQGGDELDTSRFAGYVPAEEEESGVSTQHLTGRSTHEAPAVQGTAYEEFQGPIFRARVSRFRQPEPVALNALEDAASPQLTRPMGVAPFDYEPEPQYVAPIEQPPSAHVAPAAPVAAEKISTATLTPVPGHSGPAPVAHAQPQPQAQGQPQGGQHGGGFTSGPLPALEGFHHLQEIVASRPNDVGARMALAVAYTQAGHVDHALYEFRRILQNRNVPVPMLGFIEDQINELEIEPSSGARFHQLRGDLYMKQGRYQEAIEEYNQIK